MNASSGSPARSRVVKCLVAYHPDDEPALRREQIDTLRDLQDACIASMHELLMEVIPPRTLPADDITLARALAQLYAAGIRPDWWKLPPAETNVAWEAIDRAIRTHDPLCRGVLLLGLDANEDALEKSFAIAAPHAICKGFAVGRSIFSEAATAWFARRMTDDAVVADIAERYARLIAMWREARAAATSTRTARVAN